jgi:AraC family transcriptional regulator
MQPFRPGERLRLLAELATPAGSLAEVAYAPGWCEGRHRHRNASFIYIVDGDHWATHSRGGDTARADTVRYLPAGEPHEVYFPLGSTCLQLELESSMIELAAEHGRPLECPGEIRAARAAPLGARLHQELFTRDDLSQLDVEGVALELLLTGEPAGRAQARGAPPWVLRIGDQLREELTTRFALQAIARSVGRHPVQVSRQFHEHFGCTLSEYVRRARVARAQELLRHTTLGISDIALACGFADQSHFTTAFRRVTGVPPRHWRIAAQT